MHEKHEKYANGYDAAAIWKVIFACEQGIPWKVIAWWINYFVVNFKFFVMQKYAKHMEMFNEYEVAVKRNQS